MKTKVKRRPAPARKRRLGKAGKRRTLKVAVPKVGDEVVIRWVDSGLLLFRSEKENKDADLKELTVHGKVVYRDEHKTVIASEYPDNLEDIHDMTRSVVLNKNIARCTIKRKAKKT